MLQLDVRGGAGESGGELLVVGAVPMAVAASSTMAGRATIASGVQGEKS
ncbi:hypothetical protein QEZ54_08680 [Catellatospora sp. KI3]|nr:hypothetical protein [Catellatospora sp. KI3]MDI1461037.1 hypothetical protein [Catellatospora sp. KI3]